MDKIKALAVKLYNEYGTADPFFLCEQLDISVFKSAIPRRTNGLYYHIRDKRVILINDSLAPQKQRFTAAHELGHALLHPDSNSFFIKSSTAFEMGKFERQADRFAVCLLIQPLKERTDFPEMSVDKISCITGIDRRLLERLFEQKGL